MKGVSQGVRSPATSDPATQVVKLTALLGGISTRDRQEVRIDIRKSTNVIDNWTSYVRSDPYPRSCSMHTFTRLEFLSRPLVCYAGGPKRRPAVPRRIPQIDERTILSRALAVHETTPSAGNVALRNPAAVISNLKMLRHRLSTRMLVRIGAWATIICLSTSIAYAADRALVDLPQSAHDHNELMSLNSQPDSLPANHERRRWIGLSFKDVDGATRRYDCFVSSDAFPDSVLNISVQDSADIDLLTTDLPCYCLQFIE